MKQNEDVNIVFGEIFERSLNIIIIHLSMVRQTWILSSYDVLNVGKKVLHMNYCGVARSAFVRKEGGWSLVDQDNISCNSRNKGGAIVLPIN